MLKSQAIKYEDFDSKWYKHWAKELRQTKNFETNPIHNKFWQNAAIIQAISERGNLKKHQKALGFGVGNERVPSLLSKYKVYVTATDQNPEFAPAQVWDNGQLAHGLESLNSFGICDMNIFREYVNYEVADMNKIKAKFKNQFDIVWSNCALGHLGNIENGLKFIENSVDCLKPGGVAVHTTEVNVLSDTSTLDTGGTVIFRYKDLEKIFFKLRSKGFVCEPLVFNFGSKKMDKLISFEPFGGNNLLKIQVQGNVLSQIVLIISRPKKLRKPIKSTLIARSKIERSRNIFRRKKYIALNSWLKHYIKAQKNSINLTDELKPIARRMQISGKAGAELMATMKYKNNSEHVFFGLFHALSHTNPLLLGTDKPVNRPSKFAHASWFSRNRPSADFTKINGRIISGNSSGNLGSFSPGDTCTYEVRLVLPKKPGIYFENFCLVLEGVGVLPETEIELKITVS